MLNKFLQTCANLAQTHEYNDKLGYFHCACLVRGGSILSIGYNGLNTNGFVDYLSNYDISNKPFINKHAEADAILQARNKIDLRGSKLYVVRIRPSGGVGMSAPCPSCQHAAKRYGIKRVIYSINDTTYGTMKIV